ncbi:hypothetical protein ACFQE0_14255 [Methylobacterium komagatae]|uniref:Secreted peptide n=1 Tax=Methylobacterium komagatae TaxID=374425 RepID=A0ABW2BKG0_9HYPH
MMMVMRPPIVEPTVVVPPRVVMADDNVVMVAVAVDIDVLVRSAVAITTLVVLRGSRHWRERKDQR